MTCKERHTSKKWERYFLCCFPSKSRNRIPLFLLRRTKKGQECVGVECRLYSIFVLFFTRVTKGMKKKGPTKGDKRGQNDVIDKKKRNIHKITIDLGTKNISTLDIMMMLPSGKRVENARMKPNAHIKTSDTKGLEEKIIIMLQMEIGK